MAMFLLDQRMVIQYRVWKNVTITLLLKTRISQKINTFPWPIAKITNGLDTICQSMLLLECSAVAHVYIGHARLLP